MKPIKKIKINRDGKHPIDGYKMTIIPPSDTPNIYLFILLWKNYFTHN